MNYFNVYGSTIFDKRREIIENATFDNYRLVKHELYANGYFVSQDCNMPTTFLHNGKLYYFLTTHKGAISYFFKLNMSKEACLNGRCGVYFETKPNEEQEVQVSDTTKAELITKS